MDRFDKLFHKLMEAMTAGGAGSVLNPDQNPEYAKDDNRNPAFLGKEKKPQKRNLKRRIF
jgi:hypothetical protein